MWSIEVSTLFLFNNVYASLARKTSFLTFSKVSNGTVTAVEPHDFRGAGEFRSGIFFGG